MRDVVEALCGDLGDLAGDVVSGLGESAVFFDGLELLPRMLSQLLGQILDEPGTPGRVQHPTDEALGRSRAAFRRRGPRRAFELAERHAYAPPEHFHLDGLIPERDYSSR